MLCLQASLSIDQTKILVEIYVVQHKSPFIAENLELLFQTSLIAQEMWTESYIDIPEEVNITGHSSFLASTRSAYLAAGLQLL